MRFLSKSTFVNVVKLGSINARVARIEWFLCLSLSFPEIGRIAGEWPDDPAGVPRHLHNSLSREGRRVDFGFARIRGQLATVREKFSLLDYVYYSLQSARLRPALQVD